MCQLPSSLIKSDDGMVGLELSKRDLLPREANAVIDIGLYIAAARISKHTQITRF